MADHSGFRLLGEIDANGKRIKNRGGICAVYHNTTQTIPSGTPTAVSFNSDLYDPEDWHNTSQNNSRIYVPETGPYFLSAYIRFEDFTSGVGGFFVWRNGSNYLYSMYGTLHAFTHETGGSRRSPTLSATIYLSANDYVEIAAYQTSGSNRVLYTATMTIFRL